MSSPVPSKLTVVNPDIENADLPIVLTDDGITIFVNAPHLANAESPIVSSPSFRTTSARAESLFLSNVNAPAPIDSVLAGSVIDVSAVQLQNAPSPILSGSACSFSAGAANITSVRFAHFSNAFSPISITFAGIVILVMLLFALNTPPPIRFVSAGIVN